jgi:hypothetical protein
MEKVENLDPKNIKLQVTPSTSSVHSSHTVIQIVDDKNHLENGSCEPVSCAVCAPCEAALLGTCCVECAACGACGACCLAIEGTILAFLTTLAGICVTCAPIFLACAPFIVAIVLGILAGTGVI